jgi:UDP-glucose 4-epimerase
VSEQAPQRSGLSGQSIVPSARWLVTGGCGFIGSALVERLVAEGVRSIRIVDDLSSGTRECLESVAPVSAVSEPTSCLVGVELIVASVLDEQLALRASAGIDVIVHLAASAGVPASIADPRTDFLTNVVGTLNYLEAARRRRVPRFILASSGAVVGELPRPAHEELLPKPVSPYGAGKAAAEAYCAAYARAFGVGTVALRFANAYGPRSSHKQSVVARLIRQALTGEPLEIHGDGLQTRDFIAVGDLADAIVRAAMADVAGEVFQIATQRETAVQEIADRVKALIDPLGIAPPVNLVYGPPRPGDVRRSTADAGKARRLLGWQPRTSIDDGLEQTLVWFLRSSR